MLLSEAVSEALLAGGGRGQDCGRVDGLRRGHVQAGRTDPGGQTRGEA